MTLITSCQESQTIQIPNAQETIKVYPHTVDELPQIPSPYVTKEGMEIIIAYTKDKKYALVPVTIMNGGPLNIEKRQFGKSRQLEVDGKEFPNLAKTGLHSEKVIL